MSLDKRIALFTSLWCILLGLFCDGYAARIQNSIEIGASPKRFEEFKSSRRDRHALRKHAAHSVYNFSERWSGLSFDDRWTEFLHAVPLEKFQTSPSTGPVCAPSLQGSKDSPHLVILLHGFTACPGTWDLIRPNLINSNVLSHNGESSGHGFRVMTPTLPGHGRRFDHNHTDVVLVRELGLEPEGQHQESNHDDLSDMPTDPTPYLEFAESIGMLAERFKEEHPEGTIALLGHSLGGLIATKIALDRPRVFDRVMLMNPNFWQGNFIDHMTHFLPFLRISWADCDQFRGKNSGGYCQFHLSNVRAFVDLTTALSCNEWDIIPCRPNTLSKNGKKSEADVHQAFRDLQSFQVVMTTSDPALSNDATYSFLDKLWKWRAPSRGAKIGFCKWPREFAHNYIHPRDYPKTRDIWWTEYLNSKLEAFLAYGEPIPVVDRRGSPTSSPSAQKNECLPSSKSSLAGEHLKLLPAEQLPAYNVADANGSTRVVYVIFHGKVFKETEHLHRMCDREAELMKVGRSIILTTRLERDASIRGMFVVKTASANVPCVQLTLARIDKHDQLFAQLSTLETNQNSITLQFCDKPFVAALCAEMTCTELRLKDTTSRGSRGMAYIQNKTKKDDLVSQQPSGYETSASRIGEQVAQPIFQGVVLKESEHLHWMHARETEVVRFGSDLLLLTRKSPQDAVKSLYLIDSHDAQVAQNRSCVNLRLFPLKSDALLQEISKAHGHMHQRTRLDFCAEDFVAAVCPVLGCGLSSKALHDPGDQVHDCNWTADCASWKNYQYAFLLSAYGTIACVIALLVALPWFICSRARFKAGEESTRERGLRTYSWAYAGKESMSSRCSVFKWEGVNLAAEVVSSFRNDNGGHAASAIGADSSPMLGRDSDHRQATRSRWKG